MMKINWSYPLLSLIKRYVVLACSKRVNLVTGVFIILCSFSVSSHFDDKAHWLMLDVKVIQLLSDSGIILCEFFLPFRKNAGF